MEDLTVLSPLGEWLPPRGYLGCLLTASLWRTTVSLWRTSLFDRFPMLWSGFLRFSFSRRTCYELNRSASLLSFADVTVGILLYLILERLVFSDIRIGLPRWSSSWRTRFINRVLRPILPLLPLHRVSRQSNAAQSRQDFYRIMLGVCYNRSIVSC